MVVANPEKELFGHRGRPAAFDPAAGNTRFRRHPPLSKWTQLPARFAVKPRSPPVSLSPQYVPLRASLMSAPGTLSRGGVPRCGLAFPPSASLNPRLELMSFLAPESEIVHQRTRPSVCREVSRDSRFE